MVLSHLAEAELQRNSQQLECKPCTAPVELYLPPPLFFVSDEKVHLDRTPQDLRVKNDTLNRGHQYRLDLR